MGKPGPLTGQTLGGKYLLGDLLGKGGFGAVYQAQYVLLNRPQAIKILLEEHFSDPKFRERFLREARVLAALDHPTIVHVDELGMQGNLFYLVMPYLSGGTLQDVLAVQHGPLPLEQVDTYLAQICAALDYAHTQGVVHLDLKPLNLLRHQDGRLLLSDFGLAHLMKEGAVQGGTSLSFGTPLYMAPEHLRGQPDWRSDLYALGVMLYQMLTGQLPFGGNTPEAIMLKHVMDPPPPLRAARPDLPAALENVLAKALAKPPEQRYQQASELLADFCTALGRQGGQPIVDVYSAPTRISQPVEGTTVRAQRPPLFPDTPTIANPTGAAYTPAPGPAPTGWQASPKSRPGEPPVIRPYKKRIPYPFLTGAATLCLLLFIVGAIFVGFGSNPTNHTFNNVLGQTLAVLLVVSFVAALWRAFQLKHWRWLLLILLSFILVFLLQGIFSVAFLDVLASVQFPLVVLVFSILGPR